MKLPYLTLQPTEQILVTGAATIYSGYISAGKVEDGKEAEMMNRAINATIRIEKVTDNLSKLIESSTDVKFRSAGSLRGAITSLRLNDVTGLRSP